MMMYRKAHNPIHLVFALCLIHYAASCCFAQESGEYIRSATGVTEGLYVHLGCGDGSATIGLTDGKSILVHGLAKSDSEVDAARNRIVSSGLEGVVTVERATSWNPLPYAQHLANCIVADLDALGSQAPPERELLRVLAPFGVLYTKKDGSWKKYNKPLPSTMDEWTHYEHGPDGNSYSRDKHLNPSLSAQWIGGYWERNSRANNIRISGGKCTYFRDLTVTGLTNPTGNSHIVSRDAFSGVMLWRKPAGRLERGGAMAMAGDTIFTILGSGQRLVAISASTGTVLRTYTELPELKAEDKKGTDLGLVYDGGVLYLGYREKLYAVKAATGTILWEYTEGPGFYMYYPRTSPGSNAVYALVTSRFGWNLHNHSHWAISGVKALIALDKNSGQKKWRQTDVQPYIANLILSPEHGLYSFVASGSVTVVDGVRIPGHIIRYNHQDGSKVWHKVLPEHFSPYNPPETMAIGSDYGVAFSDRYVDMVDLATGNRSSTTKYAGNGLCLGGFLSPNFLYSGFGSHYNLKTKQQFTTSHTALGCNERPFPAYGMMYIGESGCQCYYPYGGVKASSSEPFGTILDDSKRLEKGSALSKSSFAGIMEERLMRQSAEPLGKSADQAKALLCSPCYNYSPGIVSPFVITSSPLRDDWTSNDAHSGTMREVVSGGVTYRANMHQQRIDAIQGGTIRWSFRAGGRISSAPVISGNLCLFGSNDGWIYCIDIGSGKLIWRFLAAPYDKKMVAYSQVESAWPAMGVVVSGGKVFATAGRHPELNGGIWAWALNAANGSIVWKSRATRKQLEWHDGTKTISGATSGRPALNVVNAAPQISGGTITIPNMSFSMSDGKMSASDSYTSSGPFSAPVIPVSVPKTTLSKTAVANINLTHSHFVLPAPGHAFVVLCDAQGRLLKILYNGQAPQGRTSLSTPYYGAGIRFIRLIALGQTVSRQLLQL